MGFHRVGILSIGEMGFQWASLLQRHHVEVLSCVEGRSELTRRRAGQAGVRLVSSYAELVSAADLVVSVVIPSAAKPVGTRVARALSKVKKKGLVYLDANAISPMVATALGKVLSRAGALFIDGCIIGSASRMGRGTMVYVSGPQASLIEALGECGFSVKVLGPEAGHASAFKILYAGLTKGLQGLFVELLLGAKKLGLLEEILQRYNESYDGLADHVGGSITALPVHAGRRAEEMAELARTLRYYGLRPIMAPATRRLLTSIALLKTARAAETPERPLDLRAALDLFSSRGLLKLKRGGKRRAS